ncbi:hypothetical protein T492DRAFT_383964 [Pavlovales sp. CCMP2436]|nr:hypothetical protein T492DRAFT_383964 [Pavlovales sp. CCMP2436]
MLTCGHILTPSQVPQAPPTYTRARTCPNPASIHAVSVAAQNINAHMRANLNVLHTPLSFPSPPPRSHTRTYLP